MFGALGRRRVSRNGSFWVERLDAVPAARWLEASASDDGVRGSQRREARAASDRARLRRRIATYAAQSDDARRRLDAVMRGSLTRLNARRRADALAEVRD